MTEQMYDLTETGAAFRALKLLANDLPEPFVLIGGWAVYLTVDESYRKAHGVGYLGSRDIDLGFHIDKGWSVEALQNCTLARAIGILHREGYERHGSFRFCKFIEKATGKVLCESESRNVPQYDLFYLYVDMMVDNQHPDYKSVFGIDALDEPIIGSVLIGGGGVEKEYGGAKLLLPIPELLLVSKLRSLPDREKDDKIWKDACDIYAVLWHSGRPFNLLTKYVKEGHPDLCRKALIKIDDEVVRMAAKYLGVEPETYIGVVGQLDPDKH